MGATHGAGVGRGGGQGGLCAGGAAPPHASIAGEGGGTRVSGPRPTAPGHGREERRCSTPRGTRPGGAGTSADGQCAPVCVPPVRSAEHAMSPDGERGASAVDVREVRLRRAPPRALSSRTPPLHTAAPGPRALCCARAGARAGAAALTSAGLQFVGHAALLQRQRVDRQRRLVDGPGRHPAVLGPREQRVLHPVPPAGQGQRHLRRREPHVHRLRPALRYAPPPEGCIGNGGGTPLCTPPPSSRAPSLTDWTNGTFRPHPKPKRTDHPT